MRVLGLFSIIIFAFSVYGGNIVKKVGENVFVSSPLEGTDTVSFHFRRCMANELYTFYSVSLISGEENVIVNQAYSDNIGPYSIVNGGWCGGNHLYLDNKTRTACTVSVECFADGCRLFEDEAVDAEKVEINVENVIYNPLSVQNAGGKITFFDTLCLEYVKYTVFDGCVQVDLRHEYKNGIPVTVDRYYGMQSMFEGEEEILTPLGEYSSWTPVSKVSRFTKDACPEFRWFIERNDKGYQSAYLFNRGLGTHCDVADDDVVFIGNSYGKCYHKQIGAVERVAGDSDYWSGVYSWFSSPLFDAGGVFACRGIADNRQTVIISCAKKGEFMIPLPEYLHGRKINMVESSSGMEDVSVAGNILFVKSNGAATAVVAFNVVEVKVQLQKLMEARTSFVPLVALEGCLLSVAKVMLKYIL